MRVVQRREDAEPRWRRGLSGRRDGLAPTGDSGLPESLLARRQAWAVRASRFRRLNAETWQVSPLSSDRAHRQTPTKATPSQLTRKARGPSKEN